MHVKIVLIIGDYKNKANTRDWILTVGDNPDPLLNPQVYPISGTSTLWATEVKVGLWG
jgi:hypothetical protein